MRQRILVLGDDAKAFLAVVRSLGRLDLEVHAAPSDFAAPALTSRYVAKSHRLPSYTGAAGRWEAAVRGLIERECIAWVVPTSDSSLMMLMRHGDALGRERLALPGARAGALFTDKAKTRRLAFDCGVPVCRGRPVMPADDGPALAEAFGLPLVLKPRRSWSPHEGTGKKEARIVRTREALARALEQRLAGAWIAESFFAGCGVGVSVLALGGKIVAAIQHRRLEEEHETGPSTRRVTEPLDPQLLAWVRDLAAVAGLDGVAMFEFRRDPASGEHVLLEVNPRFWGSLPLAIEAGIDFPALLYAARFGSPPAPAFDYRVGCARTDLIGEYCRLSNRFEGARSSLARWAAALGALTHAPRLLGARHFDSWAADDPEPFHAERRQLLAKAREAIRRRLPRRRGAEEAPRALETAR